jgi:hypothetical protein
LTGSTWSLVENITQMPGVDSETPAMSLTADGCPLVAWSETMGGQSEVESSLRGSLNWSTPDDVSNSLSDSMRSRIARALNDLIVMWNEGTTPGTVAWAFGAHGTWTSARTLVSGTGDWGDVAPAAGQEGTVHYVYDGAPGANCDIFYNSLALSHLNLPLIVR